jgi:two-component system OmpR family response regulator
MTQTTVLVVEDDQTLRDVLKYNLVKEGYAVVTATNGLEAVNLAHARQPGLIILDLMLPQMSGLEVCRVLRKDMIVPILMLTAKAEELDKIVGLEVGADDYVTKPFSMRELLARVRAILRRSEIVNQEKSKEENSKIHVIQADDIEIDLSRHSVQKKGVPIELNPKEFDLLVFLARNKGQVFGRETLLEKVWGYDYAGDTRTVDVHMRWLRQKIEDDSNLPKYLVTVRGVGYKFEEGK